MVIKSARLLKRADKLSMYRRRDLTVASVTRRSPMIQRIEHGRVQVNENPSKKKRRPRHRPSRPHSQESEKGRAVKPPIIKATLDFTV